MLSPHTLEIFEMANIWLVMSAIGLYQLYLQYNRQPGQRFAEGWPKYLQMASGIPALLNLALFMCDPDLSAPHIEGVLNGTGVVLLNASAILVLWCHVTLGRYWSGDLETQPDHKLIDTGPYALVRHPLYSSYVALGLGLFAMSGSWAVGLSALLYFVAVATRIPKEEAMLEERLGEAYSAYARVTGCVLPHLRRRRVNRAAANG